MLKLFFVGFAVIFSSFAFATEVKITSFRFLTHGPQFSPLAELCGELTSSTGKPEMINITSDPDSKGAASYHIWSGKDGKFCSVIATFTGKANAEKN